MTWKEKERERKRRGGRGGGKKGERDKGNCEQRERKEKGVW